MKYAGCKDWILVLLLTTNSILGYSQEIYEIKGATVVIELDYGDSATQLQSKHLHVRLDNDNAEFIAKLDLKTLINTKGDNKQKQVFLTGDEVVMTGKFKVDYIETSNHVPLQFEFAGVLFQNTVEIPVNGLAELQHIGGGGSVSCMLGYSFEIDQETLRTNNIGNLNLQKVKVQVLQTILNKNINY